VGKKHAHEEHENHERWVISFADMMTLLFALFVVLYALKTDESAAKTIVKTFAVSIDGSGRSRVLGEHAGGDAGGAITDGLPLHNAQKPDLKLLLQEILADYSSIDGTSKVTRQLDDMTMFETSLDATYDPNRLAPLPAAEELLTRLIGTAKSYHSLVRVRMQVRDGIAGKRSDGIAVSTLLFSAQRLQRLRQWMEETAGLEPGSVQIELANIGYAFGSGSSWQRDGKLSLIFTNDL
jgi:flagellar motor protein MotB